MKDLSLKFVHLIINVRCFISELLTNSSSTTSGGKFIELQLCGSSGSRCVISPLTVSLCSTRHCKLFTPTRTLLLALKITYSLRLTTSLGRLGNHGVGHQMCVRSGAVPLCGELHQLAGDVLSYPISTGCGTSHIRNISIGLPYNCDTCMYKFSNLSVFCPSWSQSTLLRWTSDLMAS